MKDARPTGRRDHALGARNVDGQRFLAQDVLAGFDRRDRLDFVGRVRRRDVDGVDGVVLEQTSQRVRGRGYAPAVREGAGLRGCRTRHVHDATATRTAERRCESAAIAPVPTMLHLGGRFTLYPSGIWRWSSMA